MKSTFAQQTRKLEEARARPGSNYSVIEMRRRRRRFLSRFGVNDASLRGESFQNFDAISSKVF